MSRAMINDGGLWNGSDFWLIGDGEFPLDTATDETTSPEAKQAVLESWERRKARWASADARRQKLNQSWGQYLQAAS